MEQVDMVNATLGRVDAPTLPTELWLQILEQATALHAIHLWTTVHHVSQRFRGYVERKFLLRYLPDFPLT